MDVPVDISRVCLETPRLCLRPWRWEDLADFYAYASVPGVGEQAGWPHHETLEDSRKILGSFMEEKDVFALEEKETGRVIGSLGLHEAEWANEMEKYAPLRMKEVGYVLAQSHWGRGLMPEAVRRVIDWCFDEVGLDALTVGHFMGNSQSRRVIEKCGFAFEKKGVFHAGKLNRDFEEMQYILFRGERKKMSLSPQWIGTPAQRGEIAEKILRALPDWFGIEQSTQEYVEISRTLPLCAVIEREDTRGFAALKIHNAYSAEIYVMGVLPQYHRQGVGHALMDTCKEYCREQGIAYLQVKTLDASAHSREYDRTRAFYLAQGFVPLECFPTLWGERNPCLVMVQRL